MDGDINCNCKLELNPDITGIGVRVALYVQVLLGWFMSLLWPETFAENSRAAYMTALALIIASFIELTTQTLSLLDGIVVSFITTMMITFAIASYSVIPEDDNKDKSADEKKSFSRWLVQGCFVVFWGAWCFNMWRDPAHFGLKDDAADCLTNYNITIQLFTKVHATDSNVRSAALALVSIGFFTAFLSLFVTLEQFLLPVFWVIGKIKGEENPDTNARGFIKYKDNPVLLGIHFFLQAIAVGTFIFLIYATEQTINQNDVAGETKDWTYGQTIALILLLQQIMQLFSTFIEQREKKREAEERKATENGDFPEIELGNQPSNSNDLTATTLK